MSTIHSEDFDGSSSLPSDWNFSAAVFSVVNTELGVSPSSAPNMLSALVTSTGGPIFGNWNTGDGNSGNVTVQSWLNYHVASGNPGWTGVFCRGTAATMTTSGSAYIGRVNWNTQVPELGLFVAGSWTSLAIGDGLVLVPQGSNVYPEANGSTIALAIRRPSDGFYLNSSDTWQSSPAYHLTATDSALTGSGYAGVYAEPNGSSFNAFFDDWSLTTPGLPTPGESGSLSRTESHDSGSIAAASASPTAAGTIAKIESRDSASMSASEPRGTIARAESRDAGSLSATLAVHAASAPAERHDAGALAAYSARVAMAASERHDRAEMFGQPPDATLDQLDGRDALSASGEFIAAGSLSIPDGPDAATLRGFQRGGQAAVQERGDSGSLSGTNASVAAPAIAERPDSGSLRATSHNSNTLAAAESRDVGSLAGVAGCIGSMAPRDGRDAGSLSAGTIVRFGLEGVESRDRSGLLAVSLGIPPSFRVRERGDVGSLLGGNPTLRYNVYMGRVAGGPIDYTVPVATTQATTWSTGTVLTEGSNDGPFPAVAFPGVAFTAVAFPGTPKAVIAIAPGAIPLSCPGVWRFAVRAANGFGEEKNLDCQVAVTFDADGDDISNLPPPPTGLVATAGPSATIRVAWTYRIGLGARTPSGFRVYVGSGAPDYGSPAATVPYSAGLLGSWTTTLAGLRHGDTYAIGVRAYNGISEEQNTAFVTCVADGSGPSAVLGLSAVAVA